MSTLRDLSTNGKTISERTTLYDGRGRVIAATAWQTPLGAVDPDAPPIAGWNSVSAADGLTAQYLYDDDLADGVGLDASGGLSYSKMATGSGTSTVSLVNAIAKLADTQANGGAEIQMPVRKQLRPHQWLVRRCVPVGSRVEPQHSLEIAQLALLLRSDGSLGS